jgi:TatD DNase family protein
MYIDSHAHLTSPQVVDHVEEMLQRAQQHKVEKIVNICTDEETLKKGLILSERHPWVFNAAATTPHDVAKEGASFFPIVEHHAKELVALGETGLDYHYQHSPQEVQKKFLQKYFDLAQKVKRPLIFHCRDAFSDLFEMADASYSGLPAILHCFTGSIEEARKCLARGWLISFSGIITFKKSEALREVVAYVPLDRMVIETDTPYLAPQSKRGKLNEPGYIGEVAAAIAHIQQISVEEVAKATSSNASQFFSFSKQI